MIMTTIVYLLTWSSLAIFGTILIIRRQVNEIDFDLVGI